MGIPRVTNKPRVTPNLSKTRSSLPTLCSWYQISTPCLWTAITNLPGSGMQCPLPVRMVMRWAYKWLRYNHHCHNKKRINLYIILLPLTRWPKALTTSRVDNPLLPKHSRVETYRKESSRSLTVISCFSTPQGYRPFKWTCPNKIRLLHIRFMTNLRTVRETCTTNTGRAQSPSWIQSPREKPS